MARRIHKDFRYEFRPSNSADQRSKSRFQKLPPPSPGKIVTSLPASISGWTLTIYSSLEDALRSARAAAIIASLGRNASCHFSSLAGPPTEDILPSGPSPKRVTGSRLEQDVARANARVECRKQSSFERNIRTATGGRALKQASGRPRTSKQIGPTRPNYRRCCSRNQSASRSDAHSRR